MHDRRTIRTALASVKGNIYKKNIYVPELFYPTTKNIYKFKGSTGVIDTACTIFVFENRSFLGKFEAEFKKALARESGV
jgi:hypothetical protein